MYEHEDYLALQRKLKRRGVHLNTLHAAMRCHDLDGKHRVREREQRIIKLIELLGGMRQPDLPRITGLTQPTLWRHVALLKASGALRIVRSYNDHLPGPRATWLQPPGSPDLTDDRRDALMETTELIHAYVPYWQAKRARLRYAQQHTDSQPIDDHPP